MKNKNEKTKDKTIKIPPGIYEMILRIKERTDLPIKHIVKRAVELWETAEKKK